MFSDLRNTLAEIKEFKRLPDEKKEIVFYSEIDSYYSHFKPIIDSLIKKGYSKNIAYLCSSKTDPGLKLSKMGIPAFNIQNDYLRTGLLNSIKTKVLLMSTPDLQSFQIKRSVYPVHYVYIHHSMISTHMGYQKNAFDHFDTVFCVGPYQKIETRAHEKFYGLKQKNLIEHGYSKLDQILSKNSESKKQSGNRTVLLAPSWGEHCIIETIGEEVIQNLLDNNLKVIVRPHPQTIRLNKKIIAKIRNLFDSNDNFYFDDDVTSSTSLYESNLMISDWSGAALEYAFGLKKPVLFIDVKRKINNKDYKDLDIEPIEVSIRDKIGSILSMEDISQIGKESDYLIKNAQIHYEKITRLCEKYIFNIGHSGDAGADELIKILKST